MKLPDEYLAGVNEFLPVIYMSLTPTRGLGCSDLISLSSCDFYADRCSRRYGLVTGVKGIGLDIIILLFGMDKIWCEKLLHNSVDRFIYIGVNRRRQRSSVLKDETVTV